MTPADIQAELDRAVQALKATRVAYPRWAKYTAAQKQGTYWQAAFDLIAKARADVALLAPSPSPSPGWTVAAPQPPVTVITNPVDVGINVYRPTDPRDWHDIEIDGGGDSACLVEPDAGPGVVLERILCRNVAAQNLVGWGKHALYAKGVNLSVYDFKADSSPYAASGISSREAGFHCERFQLDGFWHALTHYEETLSSPGTVTYLHGRGTFRGDTAIWLSLNAAPQVVQAFHFEDVHFDGPGPFFLKAEAGKYVGPGVTIKGCTLHGSPVTAGMVAEIPAGLLSIS